MLKATKWGLVIMVFMLSGFSGELGAEKKLPPYYRFWRGFKKDGLHWNDFHKALVTDFMPATVKTHGHEGLVSYMVVLPIASGTWNFPDEVALVAYESEEVYRTVTATPHGKAYQVKHGEIFANKFNSPALSVEIPGQSRISHSLVPVDFSAVTADNFRKEAAYDVIAGPIDWQKGCSMFYLGHRNPSLRPDFFWDGLFKHITAVKSAYAEMGLQGYVVLTSPNYEMAFMNWKSKEAMEKAMESPQGQALAKEAGQLLQTVLWREFQDFTGNVMPGECVNYKFERP